MSNRMFKFYSSDKLKFCQSEKNVVVGKLLFIPYSLSLSHSAFSLLCINDGGLSIKRLGVKNKKLKIQRNTTIKTFLKFR